MVVSDVNNVTRVKHTSSYERELLNYRRDIRAVSPYLSTETYTGMKLLPFQSLVRHGGFPALPILVSPDVDLAYLRFHKEVHNLHI